MTDATAAYKSAYARLARLTPIPVDCGLLCGRKCCGGGADAGMILFPHEPAPDGWRFAVTGMDMRGQNVRFAVCTGRCRRETRSLSCRIFPFAPVVRGDTLQIIPDPRAKIICPLLDKSAEGMISPAFERAVYDVFSRLMSVPGMDRFLEAYTEMLSDYARFMP